MELTYKRIVIKVSGEAMSGNGNLFDSAAAGTTVDEIVKLHAMGVELGVVVGGGNIWRGREGRDLDRTSADYMGMLSTAINALFLKELLAASGIDARIMTAFSIDKVGELYHQVRAMDYLKEGKVLLFACGTGNPFFSTDSGASLRAVEIGADALLLAKAVDGIYDSDPHVNKDAKRYPDISYTEYLSKGLKVMDASAVSIAAENNLKVVLFGFDQKDGILRVVQGEKLGTVMHG